MADSSILLKQFNGSNYSQYFPQNLPLDIANQFVNSEGKNSNDIFNYLRKYCQYWWRKYFEGQVTEYSEVKADITKTVEIYSEYRYRYNYEETPPVSFSFQFSPSITINSEGIKLKEAQNYTITFITYNYLSEWENDCIAKINSFLKENAPCYCVFSGVIYYLPQGTTVKNHNEDATIRIYDYTDDNNNDYHIIQLSYISSTRPNIKAQNVTATSKTYQKTETQYVNSINKSAYPDEGKIDNWLYTYLGIPFENTVDPLKCQYGTYTGTGNYGSANSNSLTFSFQPSFLIINDGSYCIFCGVKGALIGFGYNGDTIKENTSWDKNTITWYYSFSVRHAEHQMNSSGETYYYFAIK